MEDAEHVGGTLREDGEPGAHALHELVVRWTLHGRRARLAAVDMRLVAAWLVAAIVVAWLAGGRGHSARIMA
jgi:hypothetical protein